MIAWRIGVDHAIDAVRQIGHLFGHLILLHSPERFGGLHGPGGDRVGKVTTGRAAWAEALEAASRGILPAPPDFSAPSHKRYRPKLAELVALAQAGDAAGLKAVKIVPYSSSPKAMDRYRVLSVLALETRAR